jgi:hypothetical protein
MTLSLLLGLTLIGLADGELPLCQSREPVIKPLDIEALRKKRLADTRELRSFFEDSIESFEKDFVLFSQFPEDFPPERIARLRQKLEPIRESIERLKKQERKYLEQQPGGYTAPAAPREVSLPRVAPPPREK